MVQSLYRVMEIVELFTNKEEQVRLNLSEISELRRLPLSTTHRMVGILMEYDYLKLNEETKKYSLGDKWMVEGLRQLGNHSLRSVAHPIMKEMSLELKESIYLSIPGKYSSTLIERLDSPARVRVVDNLGDRFAMHLGAPNKVMLAFSTFEFVQDVLNYYGETDQEEHYTRELAQIKKLGYAISYGEITEGTIAIAAPILGMDDNVQGALCLNLIQHQVSDEYVESLISPIMKGAGKVSRRVGGK